MCVFVGGNGRSKIIPFPLAVDLAVVAEIHGIEVPVEDGKKQNPLGQIRKCCFFYWVSQMFCSN